MPAAPTTLTDLLRRIAADLDALHRRWALVGGLAVHAHTRAGSVDDIDLVVASDGDLDAEALVMTLQDRGYSAVTGIEQRDVKALASVRLAPTDAPDAPPVQLLFASSGLEPEILRDARTTTVLGLDVPVASVGHLIALKVLSHDIGRPQDAEDIASLLKASSEDDFRQAEDAFVIIKDRGFDRDRDLMADYEAFLAREPATGS